MLQADTTLRTKGLVTHQSYKLAAGAVIHHHAIVATNAAGFLVRATDTAGLRVVGLATVDVDNTDGVDGALECRVYKGGVRIPTTGPSALDQADVGDNACVLDDEFVVRAAGTTAQIKAGEVLEIEDGYLWINLGIPVAR